MVQKSALFTDSVLVDINGLLIMCDLINSFSDTFHQAYATSRALKALKFDFVP